MNQIVKKSHIPFAHDQIDSNTQNWQLPEFAGGISAVTPLNKRDQKAIQKQYQKQPEYLKVPEVSTTRIQPSVTKKPPQPSKKQNQQQKKEGAKDLKRRGRKRERDDVYFEQGYAKIAGIQAKLKTAKADGMKVEDRQRLRNQISAQKSRLKKKEENMFLNKKVREKDQLFTDLVASTLKHIDPTQIQSMMNDVARLWKVPSAAVASNAQPSLSRRVSAKMTKNTTKSGPEDLKELLLKNFLTTQNELDQFQQNDEKEYEEDDE